MKDKNELHLNHATMIEAMDIWPAHTFKNPPKVTSVRSTGGHSLGFTVTVDADADRADSADDIVAEYNAVLKKGVMEQ